VGSRGLPESFTPPRVGEVVRVQVTGRLGDQLEIRLGGQRLLASSPFLFPSGTELTLRVEEATPERLVLRLIPRGEAGRTQLDQMLAALGVRPSAEGRALLVLMEEAGLPLTREGFLTARRLVAELPPERQLLALQLAARLMAMGAAVSPEWLVALVGRLPDERRRALSRVRAKLAGLEKLLAGEGEAEAAGEELRGLVNTLYRPAEEELGEALALGRREVVLESLVARIHRHLSSLPEEEAWRELAADLEISQLILALSPSVALLTLPLTLGEREVDVEVEVVRYPPAYHTRQIVRLRFKLEPAGEVMATLDRLDERLRVHLYLARREALAAARKAVGELIARLSAIPAFAQVGGEVSPLPASVSTGAVATEIVAP